MSGYPVILNGDHAEFEQEWAKSGQPASERPDWPLPSFDAQDWAKAFCRSFIIQHRDGYNTRPVDDDEGVMLAWFAGALMRGFDEHASRMPDWYKRVKKARDVLEAAAAGMTQEDGR